MHIQAVLIVTSVAPTFSAYACQQICLKRMLSTKGLLRTLQCCQGCLQLLCEGLPFAGSSFSLSYSLGQLLATLPGGLLAALQGCLGRLQLALGRVGALLLL